MRFAIPYEDAMSDIMSWFQERGVQTAIFVAHNAVFDRRLFNENNKRKIPSGVVNGNTLPFHEWVCTQRLLEKKVPGLDSYQLGDLAAHYGIKCDDAHNAQADVRILMDILVQVYGSSDAAISGLAKARRLPPPKPSRKERKTPKRVRSKDHRKRKSKDEEERRRKKRRGKEKVSESEEEPKKKKQRKITQLFRRKKNREKEEEVESREIGLPADQSRKRPKRSPGKPKRYQS